MQADIEIVKIKKRLSKRKPLFAEFCSNVLNVTSCFDQKAVKTGQGVAECCNNEILKMPAEAGTQTSSMKR